MREVDKKAVLKNINEMINVLEYDASRSPGKTKANCSSLYYLHALKNIYTEKPTTKKEVK